MKFNQKTGYDGSISPEEYDKVSALLEKQELI